LKNACIFERSWYTVFASEIERRNRVARRKAGIEELILEWVGSGPVAAVELTLRLANAQFKKRIGPLAAAGQKVRRVKKPEAVETVGAGA
jgi:hypothetical protein